MSDKFLTLSDLLPPTAGDMSADRGAAASLRLRQAYSNFRRASVTSEDVDLILVDLAKASGYYNTTSPDTDPMTLKYYEGMRALFGRMQRFMNPPYSEMEALQRAVVADMTRDAEAQREVL